MFQREFGAILEPIKEKHLF